MISAWMVVMHLAGGVRHELPERYYDRAVCERAREFIERDTIVLGSAIQFTECVMVEKMPAGRRARVRP